MSGIVDRASSDITVELPEVVNSALLEVVADYIERHPEEFDMGFFHPSNQTPLDRVRAWWRGQCGSVGCVAYHTVRLAGGDCEGNIPAQAQRLLGLSDEQAHSLFYAEDWPEPYADEFDSLGDNDLMGRAWVAAQVVRYFAKVGCPAPEG